VIDREDITMKNKRASAALVILIILIVIIVIGWLIKIGNRQCDHNNDCGKEHYCGSDFQCHEFQIIEKDVVHYHFTTPAIILGICLIIAAYIFKQK